MPVGFRFICSTVNSIGRPFGVRLQVLLKRIFGFLKFKFRNSSFFIVLDNSTELIDRCKGFSNFQVVDSFDFDNLFTSIPIELLFETLLDIFSIFCIEEELNIEFGFFKKLTKFCLFNNFIKFNDKLYRQCCGIGMGTNYSSTAANLFLFLFEYKYVVYTNKCLNFFRYIDDLIVFKSDFDSLWINIYPTCLFLKKTSGNNKHVDFLDLSIDLIDGCFSFDIFDKRKNFSFSAISMPHWSTNLNKRVFINTIISQFLRFFKVCTSYPSLSKQNFLFTAGLYYQNNFPLEFINHYLKHFRSEFFLQ